MAFTFDFDAEEVWIGDDPANADRPGVLSQGTYGAKVAVPLILELLERHGLRQTFFVPGRVAERHPERVREILAAGHEVGHHGYTHTSPADLSTPQAEEDELVRALDVLRGLGADPVGYRSPSWGSRRPRSACSSGMGSATRRTTWTTSGPISIPGSLGGAADPVAAGRRTPLLVQRRAGLDALDLAAFGRARDLVGELEGIVKLGGCCIFTMHPQVIGRPHRLAFLDRLITEVAAREDVWIATCGEIAAVAAPPA